VQQVKAPVGEDDALSLLFERLDNARQLLPVFNYFLGHARYRS
jgi:hypothetical protein